MGRKGIKKWLNDVHQMDCLEGMQAITGESVDVIITSPPYNIGVDYNEYRDQRPHNEYIDWMNQVFHEAQRILKPHGSLFLNMAGRNQAPWVPWEVVETLRRDGWHIQNVIHWVKSFAVEREDFPQSYVPTSTERELLVRDFLDDDDRPPIKGRGKRTGTSDSAASLGHFRPINSSRFLYGGHEYIFHLTKTGALALDKDAIGVPYKDRSNTYRWDTQKTVRDRGNVWVIPHRTVHARNQKSHPCTFPEKLPLMCLRLHGYTSETVVLDPFSGTGTTVAVAKQLGAQFIGFEIDEEYRNASLVRLEGIESVSVEKPEILETTI